MIFSAVERMIALRYLRARRQEGFISVIAGFSLLGIALGVATLIVVMAVMNGFRAELVGRVLGLNGHLNVFAARGGPLPEYDGLAARLRQVPGVVAVAPIVEGQGLVAVSGRPPSGAVVRGMMPQDFRTRPALAAGIRAGSPDALAEEDTVAIGVRMAERLNLKPGDSLTLISPQGNATAFGTIPRSKTYRVGAVFDVGMFEYDNSFVFMPLEQAQAFFRLPAMASSLEVMVNDPSDTTAVRDALTEAAAGRGRVADWQQSNTGFLQALQVERNVMFLILTLIILVAAFNIISSLIMLVKDKGRDIAILRTMGASRGMVMRVFFLSGAAVGIVGTLLGLVLGVAFATNIESIRQVVQAVTGVQVFSPEIYFLTRLPARIEWLQVGQVVVMALALSFAATLYPSWRAARLDPVEALRYE